jgi:hypothetical protein
MGNILIEINEVTRNNKKNVDYKDLYKLRKFNNIVFIFYTIIFIIAIYLQFNHNRKNFLTNIMKSIK